MSDHQAGRELPRWKCHKVVHAIRIAGVHVTIASPTVGRLDVDPPYAPIEVDADYLARHKPAPGGYYVVYADGYRSYSPREAFEDGYKPESEVRVPVLFEGIRPEYSDAALENRFLYHPPTSRPIVVAHDWVSRLTLELAKHLRDLVPPGRGLSLALTKLEECRMWANQGIATDHDAFKAED